MRAKSAAAPQLHWRRAQQGSGHAHAAPPPPPQSPRPPSPPHPHERAVAKVGPGGQAGPCLHAGQGWKHVGCATGRTLTPSECTSAQQQQPRGRVDPPKRALCIAHMRPTRKQARTIQGTYACPSLLPSDSQEPSALGVTSAGEQALQQALRALRAAGFGQQAVPSGLGDVLMRPSQMA